MNHFDNESYKQQHSRVHYKLFMLTQAMKQQLLATFKQLGMLVICEYAIAHFAKPAYRILFCI